MAYRLLVLYHCGAVCKKLLSEALQPPQSLTLRAVPDERAGGNLLIVLGHQAGASGERASRAAQHPTFCWQNDARTSQNYWCALGALRG